MATKLIIGLLGFFVIFPVISISAYAENSWIIFINPYEDAGKSELFQPKELPIFSGDKVTWKNNDSVTHKIVSGVPEYPDYSGEFFSTDSMSNGKEYSISLDFEGYAGYYYYCEIHPWFTGKIFFEDRPDIFYSTLDISYEILQNKRLEIKGLVESDLGKSEYQILIYNSKNQLVFQKVNSFEQDASFNMLIDISDPIWNKDEKYTLKLVYGVPSESTTLQLNIPNKVNSEKIKYLEFCQEIKSKSSFLYEKIRLPGWYKTALCWYDNELMSEKELSDSLNFFRKSA